MRKFMVAVAVAGVFAVAHPAFADTQAASASDHIVASVPASEQPAPPSPAASPSSEAKAPANTGLGKNVIPVGFGWG